MNFFEHKVRIAFLLGHVRSPRNGLGLPAHAHAAGVPDLDSLSAYNGHFAVPQQDYIPRVLQQLRDIRRHEIFTRAHTDNNGRAISRCNNFSAVTFSGNDNNSVYALDILQGAADGLLEVTVVVALD